MYFREIKDPNFIEEKMNTTSAKEAFQHFHKIEQDYRHQFSGRCNMLVLIYIHYMYMHLHIWSG